MNVLHIIEKNRQAGPVEAQMTALQTAGSLFAHESEESKHGDPHVRSAVSASYLILHNWDSLRAARKAPITIGPFFKPNRESRVAGPGVTSVAEIHGEQRLVTLPVAVDANRLAQLRDPIGVELKRLREQHSIDETRTVVGLLVESEKTAERAVTCALQLSQNCSPQQGDALFLLLGTETGQTHARALAEERGLLEQVRLLRGSEALDLIAIADIIATFAATPTEAYYLSYAGALGVPTVRFGDSHAVSFDRQVQRIDRLIADPQLRQELGRQLSAEAAVVDYGEMAKDTEKLYSDLLAEAGLPVPGRFLGSDADPTATGKPFRIVFVTQEDPFYIPLFFREFFRIAELRRALFPEAAEEGYSYRVPANGRPVETRGVMIQRALGNKTSKGLAKRIWRLYGTLGFIRVGFRYLVAKVAGKIFDSRTVGGNAKRAGVPILPMNDANSSQFQEFVRTEEIDLVVSVSASQIFKEEILSTPKRGCINLHNAPLPQYRGMLPNFWQMYEGEQTSVLTIHQMVKDLDKGDILLQRKTEITPEMSLEDLMRKTKRQSARALWHVLDQHASDAVQIRSLPEEEGSYYTWPTREEAKEFIRRGKRLL